MNLLAMSFNFCETHIPFYQEFANFSIKGHTINILGFTGYSIVVAVMQLLL